MARSWLVKAPVILLLVVVLLSFLGRRWNARGGLFDPLPLLPTTNQDEIGAMAVVTGGAGGLGLEMVKGLYKLNYHVILACRNVQKGEEARKKIIEEEGISDGGEIVVKQLDLSSFKSVRSFVSSVEFENLKILINNAGIWASQQLTEDGIGATAQVNHYSGFLLSNLLYPKMKEGGRIVVVASAMAREGISFRPDPLLLDEDYYHSPRGGKLYGTSKLMNILHCQAFSKRSTRNITCASVHPGIIKTNLHREENDHSGWVREYVLPAVWGLIGITPFEGAQSSLMLATTQPESGRYYHGATPQDPPNELFKDVELENLLWEKSVELTSSDLS